jgi:predicted metalloprotease with PDZ domain
VNSQHISAAVGKTIAMPDHGIGNGESMPQLARLETLRVGSYLVDAPLVALSQDKVGAFASETISVNIGGNILRRFTLILDYPNGRVILEPNKHIHEPFASDASGLILTAQGDDFRTFVVQDVLPDSPASEAGLIQGDVITAIDGHSVNRYALWQLQDVFKDSGRTQRVTIQRSQSFLTLTLALRALL